MAVDFQPRIVGFLCNWCSYAGADSAGTARMTYPTNIRIIRVPCSGRVDPLLIVKAFQMGADGVLIAGCHPGDCHYTEGNYYARRRFALLRPFLDYLGIESARFRVEWVSASEGQEVVSGGHLLHGTGDQARPQKRAGCGGEAMSETEQIRSKAKELLDAKKVDCVIGYERATDGKNARPMFAYNAKEADRLIFDQTCRHDLVKYLLNRKDKVTAIVVKPCDSRAINLLINEHQMTRDKVVIIGVVCPGVVKTDWNKTGDKLRDACQICQQRTPVVYDVLIGEPKKVEPPAEAYPDVAAMEGKSVAGEAGLLGEGVQPLHPLLRLPPGLSRLLLQRVLRGPARSALGGHQDSPARERDVEHHAGLPSQRTLHRLQRLRAGVPGQHPAQPAEPQAGERSHEALQVPIRHGPGNAATSRRVPEGREAGGGRMSKFISKKDLNSWLAKVRESRRLVAPVKVEDLVLFKEIDRVEDIVSDYVNTDMSPKEFLFPPTEVLFSIAKKDGGVELSPAKVETERP